MQKKKRPAQFGPSRILDDDRYRDPALIDILQAELAEHLVRSGHDRACEQSRGVC